MTGIAPGFAHQPSQQTFGGYVVGILELNAGNRLLPVHLPNATKFGLTLLDAANALRRCEGFI